MALQASVRATQARILAAADVAAVLGVVEDSVHLNCVSASSALRRLALLAKRGEHVPVADARYARLERLLSQDVANRLDVRGLSAAAWASAVLLRPNLLEAMLAHSAPRLQEASLQEHAVVVWALGRLQLGRRHPRVLSAVNDACSRLLEEFQPLQLALHVLHDLAHRRPARHDAHALSEGDPSSTHSLRALSTTNPQSMTRLLCGFAACEHPPSRRLVDALGREASRQLALFDASTLAFFLSAHAQLGLLPHPRLLVAAPRALQAALPDAGPHAAALAVWAFARLRLHPGAGLLQAADAALAQAGAPGLRAVSTARLAGAVWAFGTLGARPVASWPALTAELVRRELRPADRSTLRAGLSRLQGSTGVQDGDAALQRAALPPGERPPEASADRVLWLSCRPLPADPGR